MFIMRNFNLTGVQSWGQFLERPGTFRAGKVIAKPRTLRLQSCFIHVFLIWTEVLFIQDVSGAFTSAFLDVCKWIKNGFTGRNSFRGFRERGSRTYLALPGFNDLGRYATPVSLLMGHFFFQFSTFTEKVKKIYRLEVWSFCKLRHPIPFFLALRLSAPRFQIPVERLSFVKTLETFGFIYATDPLPQNMTKRLSQWTYLRYF